MGALNTTTESTNGNTPSGKHSGRNKITLQCVFNILSVVYVVLITLGLWTCFLEIKRLTESTETFEKAMIDLHNQLNSVTTDTMRHSKKSKTFVYETLKPESSRRSTAGSKRQLFKRAVGSGYKTFDPLTVDPKDQNEFCWTLLYERCGGYMPGAPAAVGVPGPPGSPGQKGEPGRLGSMGHMGPPGVNGQKGHRGDTGPSGKAGETGSEGPRGPPGLPGVNGIRGSDGRRGKRGVPGHPGSSGGNGQPGVSGLKGDKGERGDSGTHLSSNGSNCTCYGMQGYPGRKGEKGDAGVCKVSTCSDKNIRRTVTEPATTTTSTTTVITTTPTTPSTVPPSLAPRPIVCRVKRISTPIFIAHDVSVHGAFLGDPMQKRKFWSARGYHGQVLEEYNSDKSMKKHVPDKRYNLRYNRYHGTQHAIYNNSFYYHFTGQQHVVRYDLGQHDVVTAVSLPGSHYNDSNYLYKGGKSYYDISADENGLWIIFGRKRGNSSLIHVMKVGRQNLDIERVWRLPFKIGEYRNSFIACGILYLIRDVEGKATQARLEVMYDLYKDESKQIDIRMKIPFQRNTMMTFYTNSASRKYSVLLAWDNGNLIKYPILF